MAPVAKTKLKHICYLGLHCRLSSEPVPVLTAADLSVHGGMICPLAVDCMDLYNPVFVCCVHSLNPENQGASYYTTALMAC